MSYKIHVTFMDPVAAGTIDGGDPERYLPYYDEEGKLRRHYETLNLSEEFVRHMDADDRYEALLDQIHERDVPVKEIVLSYANKKILKQWTRVHDPKIVKTQRLLEGK